MVCENNRTFHSCYEQEGAYMQGKVALHEMRVRQRVAGAAEVLEVACTYIALDGSLTSAFFE